MAKLSDAKADVLSLRRKGYSYDKIAWMVSQVIGEPVSRQAVHKFLKKHAPEMTGRMYGGLHEG